MHLGDPKHYSEDLLATTWHDLVRLTRKFHGKSRRRGASNRISTLEIVGLQTDASGQELKAPRPVLDLQGTAAMCSRYLQELSTHNKRSWRHMNFQNASSDIIARGKL